MMSGLECAAFVLDCLTAGERKDEVLTTMVLNRDYNVED